MKPESRNLVVRIAAAIVGLPIVGFVVLWPDSRVFAVFALLVATAGLAEYTGLTLRGRPVVERAAVVLIGVGFAARLYLAPERAAAWMMAAVVLTGIVVLIGHDEMPATAARLGLAGFGTFYVGGLVAALALVHRDAPSGPLWVVTAIGVTFANDTGAYFTGRALGRHKLAPTISPGKTIEGAVGGLFAGLAFTFAARATFFPELSTVDAILLGSVAGVVGPAGDLVESMLKRAVGAKDSGRIIPGHGGILDRIDALLFVAGYVYLHVSLAR